MQNAEGHATEYPTRRHGFGAIDFKKGKYDKVKEALTNIVRFAAQSIRIINPTLQVERLQLLSVSVREIEQYDFRA
jgi:hypothetical protein